MPKLTAGNPQRGRHFVGTGIAVVEKHSRLCALAGTKEGGGDGGGDGDGDGWV
ncbi:MAG: hypothetical protein V2A73_02715 [Pseudomonadota bacterium]